MPDGPDISTERSLALFLDFDGTLVEIAQSPEAVVVEPGLSGTLARLRDRLGGALALVSGRPIAVLDRFLRPYTFDAAGLHGVERRLGGALFPCRPDDHPALRAEVERLYDRLAGDERLILEDKGCSVAVHWRLAPERAAFAAGLVEAAAAALGPDYRLQQGKAVAEILPSSAAKGPAIERFLAEAPYRGRRPVFVGDDLTDEHGFAVVNARGGVSVRVGTEGPTQATRRVASPRAFRDWLGDWAKGRFGTIDGAETST